MLWAEVLHNKSNTFFRLFVAADLSPQLVTSERVS